MSNHTEPNILEPDYLKKLVQKMLDAGESEENIKKVVQHVQNKKGAVVKEDKEDEETVQDQQDKVIESPLGKFKTKTVFKPDFGWQPDPSVDYAKLPMMDRQKVEYTKWLEAGGQAGYEKKKKEFDESLSFNTSTGLDTPVKHSKKETVEYEDVEYKPRDKDASEKLNAQPSQESVASSGIAVPDLFSNNEDDLTKAASYYYNIPLYEGSGGELALKPSESQKKELGINDMDKGLSLINNIREESLYKKSIDEKKYFNNLFGGDRNAINSQIETDLSSFRSYDEAGLTGDYDELKKLRDQGIVSGPAIKKLEASIKAKRLKMDLGGELYDDDGNLIDVNFNGSKTVDAEAGELLQNTPNIKTLEDQREDLYYKLKAIDKLVAKDPNAVLKSRGLIGQARGLVSDVFTGMARGEDGTVQEKEGDGTFVNWSLQNIQEGATSGFLKPRRKLIGDGPLVELHNKTLKQLRVIDRAIMLNTNAMKAEEDSNVFRYTNRVTKAVLGTDVFHDISTADGQASIMKDLFKESGLEVDEETLERDINKISRTEKVVDFAGDMTPVLASFALAGRTNFKIGNTRFGVKPTTKMVDKYVEILQAGRKTKFAKKALGYTGSALNEVIKGSVANVYLDDVMTSDPMPLGDLVLFGGANYFTANLSKRLMLANMGRFSEFTRTKLGIITNEAGKMVFTGATATASAKAVAGINIGIDYLNGNTEKVEQGIHHLADIDALLTEFYFFTALGAKGVMPKQIRSKILEIQDRSQTTINAAETLGIKEFSTQESIDAAYKKLVDKQMKGINAANQTSRGEVIKKLNNAKKILEIQNGVVDAKKTAGKVNDRQAQSEIELDIIAKKLMMGGSLNTKDIMALGKYTTDIIDPKSRKPVNTTLDAAVEIVASKLNLTKNQKGILKTQFKNASDIVHESKLDITGPENRKDRKIYIENTLEAQNIGFKIAELKQKKDANPNMSANYDAQISKLNSEYKVKVEKIKEIVDNSKEYELKEYNKGIDFTKKTIEKLGYNVDDVFKELSNEEYVELSSEKGFDPFSGGSFGIENGKPKIYINRDKSLSQGSINVGPHELAHFILRESFKGKDGLITQEGRDLIDAFVETLSAEQKNFVENRLSQAYGKGTEEFKAKQYEEYITVFMDALRRGQVKETFADKALSSWDNLLKNTAFEKKIDLSTGAGIKSFIKILNKSAKTGVLDQRIVEAFGGKTEPLADTEFKLSNEETRRTADEIAIRLKEKPTTEDYIKLDDQFVRMALDAINFDSRKSQLKKQTETKDGLKTEFTEVTREDVSNDVRTYMADIIERFDPTKDVKFSTWVYNNMKFKSQEIYSKYLGLKSKPGQKEITTKRLMVPEEPSQAGRTNPLDLLSELKRQEAIEKIKSRLPGKFEINEATDKVEYKVNKDEFKAFLKDNNTYNKLRDLDVSIAAEFFGVPEAKILDKKANLSKPEASSAQRTIVANGTKLRDIIPEANIPLYKEYVINAETGEKIINPKTGEPKFKYQSLIDDASLKGAPTGVPKNLLNAFFTKGERVGNNFQWQYNNPDLPTFLKTFGIENFIKADDFTARTPDSQSVKGLMELYGRAVTNKVIRDIAVDLGLVNEANNISQGKNVYMASKEVARELSPEKYKDFIDNRVDLIAMEAKQRYNGFPPDKNFTKQIVGDILFESKLDYTTTEINNITDAIWSNLDKAANSPRMSEAFKNKEGLKNKELSDFIKVKFKEELLTDTERITRDFLDIEKGVSLLKESLEIERIQWQQEMDKLNWDTYLEGKTSDNTISKLEKAARIARYPEQFNNTTSLGGKRFNFHEGAEGFRNDLNETLEKHNIVFDGKKVTDVNTGESINIVKFGKAQHNSEHVMKKIGDLLQKGDYSNPEIKKLKAEYDVARDEARDLLEHQIYNMMDLYGRSADKIDIAISTMNLKAGMGGILRLAASWQGAYVPLPGEKMHRKNSKVVGVTADGKKIREKLLVWEHNKSAEKLLLDLMKLFSNETYISDKPGQRLNAEGNKALEEAYKDFHVNLITYKHDVVMGKAGYQVLSPLEGTRPHNSETMGHEDVRGIFNFNTMSIEGRAHHDAAIKASKLKPNNDGNFLNSKEPARSNGESLRRAQAIDKALSIARDPNAPIKKIRVFDFDDTMAKSKSSVFYNRPNPSRKPVPKQKAIFMIGGPGSGKSNIGKGLQLGREGFKVVNQDIFIETEKAKQGLPEIEKGYTKEQKSSRAKIGAAGRKAAEAKMDKYVKNGDGMVIDGTGASFNATMKKVNKLKEQGYEVFMVHAKTSNEVALERNKTRKERSLPDFIVEKTQQSVNNNIENYKKEIGLNFLEIDTETIKYGEALPKEFVSKVKERIYREERGRLNAEEFAQEGSNLIEDGFAMDFSDFNIVREGERGPMFKVAEKIKAARGNEDLFILTARAPESRSAIYEFLKSEGLEFKKENIIGLGKSTGVAKAEWLVSKAAEGYNDFFFADDAIQNVEAVKEAMSVLDVKSKVQRVLSSKENNRSKQFNKLLEQTTGVDYYKEYSRDKAKLLGAKKGNFKFFVPYSAEDFVGLIYPTLGKGKMGDSHMAWYKKNLLDPFARANENLSRDRVQMMADFKALKKDLDVPKDLRKTNESGFTNEQAVRVWMFETTGNSVETLSKSDKAELMDVVNNNPKLKQFGEQMLTLTKGDGWVKPDANWQVGTITTDIIELLNTTKRTKYLEEFNNNIKEIYSEENLNKLEALYGSKYRESMENIITRMRTGRNRTTQSNRLGNTMLNWVNGSNAAIMFFNTRSAILQMISNVNFVNWSFNNPLKAGAAFANQPQYWKDVKMLMNSEFLVDRRNGLRINIAESEIADAAATSKNKMKGALRYIMEKGYLPTQYADSFAIATGGATYYRNRVKDLVKQGTEQKQAEVQAMQEFREKAEESQQSSRPDRISQQQSSDAGRLILMFANTPMQYTRLQKRAFQDLINGRGDSKEHVSKIIYYGFVQNLIFNGLQNALFKMGFDDEDTVDTKSIQRAANGMLDTTLRGMGIGGATLSMAKNFLVDIYDRSKRQKPDYVDATLKLLQISPPIGSKVARIRSAAYTFDSKARLKEIQDEGPLSLDNPAYLAGGRVISATTNLPVDRLILKAQNIKGALDNEQDTWKRIAMAGGWPEWQLETKGPPLTAEEKKIQRKENRVKAASKSKDYEVLKKLNKVEQVDQLKSLGYSDYEIRKMKTEDQRIKGIQRKRN